MKKVIFVNEKFHSPGNETNNVFNLHGSFKASNLGEYKVFNIDPSEIWSTQGVDHVLNTEQYDVAVVSVYHHLPSPEVIRSHNVVLMWWDGIVSAGGIRHYAQFGPQINFDHIMYHPNVFNMSVPQDPTYFFRDSNVIEDIDVSFVGSVDPIRPDRQKVKDMLLNAGITNIFFGGGRGDGYANLSMEEYTGIMKRSKISLNFASGHNQKQTKGRIYELCSMGRFTLSNYPETLTSRFEEDVDFVSFDEYNVVDKVRYYLEHEDKRNAIANSFYKKYCDNYTATHFWKDIFKIFAIEV